MKQIVPGFGIALLIMAAGLSGSANAQDKSPPAKNPPAKQEKKDGKNDKTDPTAKTNMMAETLNKIRNVEQLDKFVKENSALKTENKGLKANIGNLNKQIAGLNKQIQKLTNDLKAENERMKKQLLQLPSFELKSRVVGPERSTALLKQGERTLKIREGMEMSVLVKDGVYVLMKVDKISKEAVELSFPELSRTIILYD